MKIYRKNKKGEFKEVSLRDALCEALQKECFDVERGVFEEEDYQWLEIKQRKDDEEVLVQIGFDISENEITDVQVFSTPFITVLDAENMKKII